MKIMFNGKLVEALEVKFSALEEPWSVHRVEDGVEIRLRPIVTQVLKTDQKDDKGLSIYLVSSQNVVAISYPEKKLGEAN